MKKKIILVLFSLSNIAGISYSQELVGSKITIKDAWDNVFRSVDQGKNYELIGTYQGWNKDAIYIAGYNNQNNPSFYSTKYVSFGGIGVERLWVDLLSGNVGIGTTNPSAKLDVNNSIRISPFIAGASGVGYLNTGAELKLLNGNIYNPDTNSGAKILFGGMYNPSGSTPGDAIYNSILWAAGQLKIRNNQQDKIVIGGGDEWGQQNVLVNPQGGNVGIGTTTPNTKLDVNGSILIHGLGTYYNNVGAADLHVGYGLATPCTSGAVTRLALQPYAHTGGPWNFISRDDAVNAWLDIKYGTTLGITLKNDGYIGIGTTNPDEKLTVNGVIHAKEVKVDLSGPLADFVFKPDYKLMSLPQVEQFVKVNNHLPQIPSAEEVAKNGLSMGEMQNKLLQKVEELTLYSIEQEKGRKVLEEKLAKQEQQYNALLQKVDVLTKQLDKK